MSDKFTGCKLAYIVKNELLVYKRDEFQNLTYPGFWDFPGGGRENQESPEACVLRELEEEFSINLLPTRLIYKKKVPNLARTGNAFFFVAHGRKSEIDAVSFGDEGQYWKLMPVDEYLSHPKAIPDLISRLQDYLNNNTHQYPAY